MLLATTPAGDVLPRNRKRSNRGRHERLSLTKVTLVGAGAKVPVYLKTRELLTGALSRGGADLRLHIFFTLAYPTENGLNSNVGREKEG